MGRDATVGNIASAELFSLEEWIEVPGVMRQRGRVRFALIATRTERQQHHKSVTAHDVNGSGTLTKQSALRKIFGQQRAISVRQVPKIGSKSTVFSFL